jgi:hypothetical protein
LLALSARDIGLPQADHDSTVYDRDPAHGLLEQHLRALFGPRLSKEQMQFGDIAVVNYKGEVRHAGIITPHPDGPFGIIHTDSSVKRVTVHRINEMWMRLIAGVYRP